MVFPPFFFTLCQLFTDLIQDTPKRDIERKKLISSNVS